MHTKCKLNMLAVVWSFYAIIRFTFISTFPGFIQSSCMSLFVIIFSTP